ncbi:MAG: phosphoadenylyl-sulfate reductase [Gammaproteobacteria bacterium]|nr:phosphoadenylyl-sulfate reductase [Gammaproteobacteria bacterium]
MSLNCVKSNQQLVDTDTFDFSKANKNLANLKTVERIEWALKSLPGDHALTSSFGVQSAVSLHLFQQVAPGIPVILVDTGYLFSETYQFIDRLTDQLDLNLKVFRSDISPAWQEARFGELWNKGVDGIEEYNRINKVDPLINALEKLGIKTWYAGLRREQSQSRQAIDFLRPQQERFKLHPIADWTNRDIHRYLTKYHLDYHPLWYKGYVSIGDKHTTVPVSGEMNEEDTRFFGIKRECGIHEI